MVKIDCILPLTDFKRNTAELREKLRASGRPAVLTVDGRPELVVQDAAAYQKMLDIVERAEIAEAIHESEEDFKAGRVHTHEEVVAMMRKRLDSLRKR
jgi:PHD/YefM family antitoxin component YafN of YafNO toxin-antitoxin module